MANRNSSDITTRTNIEISESFWRNTLRFVRDGMQYELPITNAKKTSIPSAIFTIRPVVLVFSPEPLRPTPIRSKDLLTASSLILTYPAGSFNR